MVTMPGRSTVTSGACPARMPISPSMPGRSTCSTSSENSTRSGETNSKCSAAMDQILRWRMLACDALGFFGQFLALLNRFLDGSNHVERGFRQMIVFAFDQALESLDGVLQVDKLAGRAGEDFGNVERLRKKALDLARARDGQLVLFRQLVHAQDGDDVLERLVPLQHLLHRARHLIVLIADNQRRQHA